VRVTLPRERDLTPLFDPRSVAVLGASADPAKWGYSVSEQLLSRPSGRDIYLVNRRGGEILGRTALRSLAGLQASVDLVAVCVPAAGFLSALGEALAAGARAVVAITAGLGETGAEGLEIERRAVEMVRQAGAVLVGPNCLGVVDNSTGLRLASDPLRSGDIAVLSQSGNMVIDLESLMAAEDLGISRFVSLGNQADANVTDFMLDCVAHEPTRAVAVYAEDVKDGRAFVDAARALADVGKPVVLLAPGSSDAGRRGAASHTGALTSPDCIIDAACKAGGIHRVRTPQEMVDALMALRQPRRARSRRVAILTDGGGHGSVGGDCLHREGLDVPVLSADLGSRLEDALWAQSSVVNPVDLAGIGEQDPLSYSRALQVLLAADEVDAVLMTGYFGGYAQTNEVLAGPEIEAATGIVAAIDASRKPVVAHTIFPYSPSIAVLRAGGIPVHRDIGRACASLALLVAPEADARADSLLLPEPSVAALAADYATVRAVLESSGVGFPAGGLVDSEAELAALLRDSAVRFPVAIKAMGLLHKSDAGGVILGVPDKAGARAALRDLMTRLAPPAVSVEEMVDDRDAVEVIVGSAWDARFGPVLMVGLGGIHAEVMHDVAFALAPVSPGTARRLLRSLQGAPLLEGARGRRPIDLQALIELVVAVSETSARHPEWSEVEVNPVIATPTGAVAVDARAVMRG
jgi:acyl-CoA synthetase (NDP forming)